MLWSNLWTDPEKLAPVHLILCTLGRQATVCVRIVSKVRVRRSQVATEKLPYRLSLYLDSDCGRSEGFSYTPY